MNDDIRPPQKWQNQNQNLPPQNEEPNQQAEPSMDQGPQVYTPYSQTQLPPKKSRKKLFLVIFFLLLLIGGGAAAYWYFYLREEPAPAPVQQNQEVTEEPITDASGKFYISKSHEEITIYDPVKKESSSVKFTLGEKRSVFTTDIHGNQLVRFSEDGTKILVANYTSEAPATGPGENIVKRQLSIFENNKETELTPLNNDQEVTPVDILLTPDGKTVYVLLASGQKEDPLQLHSIDVATKKTTVLSEGAIKAELDRTPLMLDSKGVLHFYSQESKAVTHHTVKDGKYAAANIGTLTCTCTFEYPQAVSPDGKNILVEEIKDGQKGDFTYYVFTTADGKTAQLAKPPKTTEQYLSWLWKPDSKQVALDVAGFGAGEPEFQPRVEIMDLATKQTTKVVSHENNKSDSVQILAWSPDGRLLALVENQKIKFYDTANKKLVETGLAMESVDSETQYGWLK